jgi:hypothetical protein|tara:strand:+ start:734 stop:1351 length:618 start_codon:yes stop_codon:yes gene_type:complete
MTLSKRSSLSLEDIKHVAWASNATNAFEATVYLDGEKAMITTNDGRGGANHYYGMRGQSRPSFNRMYDACEENAYEFVTSRRSIFFPEYTDEQFKNEINAYENNTRSKSGLLDLLIEYLVNEHMCLKEMKRQLKAKVVYFDKSDKSIWAIKLKPTEENLAYYKRVHEEESAEKEWIWMNDLPEDKAFYYWRKADKANKDKKNAQV